MSNDYKRIAEQYKKYKTVQGVMSFINRESIMKEHIKQQKGKATGVDGISKEEYEKEIEQNINNLIEEMKTFFVQTKTNKKNIYTQTRKYKNETIRDTIV